MERDGAINPFSDLPWCYWQFCGAFRRPILASGLRQWAAKQELRDRTDWPHLRPFMGTGV